MTGPRRVLIVEDGLGPHPLVAARSFGESGWFVGIGSPTGGGRAASSRWVAARHVVPPAEVDEAAFVAATAGAVAEQGYDLVFGADDVEVLALSSARDRLGALVPYPEHAAVLGTIDKLAVTRAAETAGVPVPRTAFPDGEVRAGLVEPLLPAVVKARLHWTPGQREVPPRLERVYCRTVDEVAAAVASMRAAGAQPIVQERVDGGLGAVTVLLDRRGRVRARLQQEAERISPLWHNSVAARTVPVDDDLVDRVAAMLRELGWWGLVNLQFLLPGGTWAASPVAAVGPDSPRLIDVNGRFYGSIALARAAGLDLPVLWARLALETSETAESSDTEGAGPPLTGRPGVRYQSLEEDLRRALLGPRGGRTRDVWATLRYAAGATHSTWARDDRRPALRRTVEVARLEGRELARRALGRGPG